MTGTQNNSNEERGSKAAEGVAEFSPVTEPATPHSESAVTTDWSPFCVVPKDLVGKVSPAALVVWCALHSFADHAGACWPSQTTLAERAALSDRQVRRCLVELEETKRLVRIKRKGRADRYHLRLSSMTPDMDVQGVGHGCPGGADMGVLLKDTQGTKPKKDKLGKPKSKRLDPDTVIIPTDLQRHERPIRLWLRYKAERGQRYTETGIEALFRTCRKLGSGLSAAVEASMSSNYSGLFAAKAAPTRDDPTW